jgi:superfamily II DNA or RNA helicase
MDDKTITDCFVRDPWPHQRQGVLDILQAIEDGHDRICVTSPTGAGKSTMMIAMIMRYLAQNSVVYQHRRALVDQFIRVFEEHGICFGVRASSFREHRRLLENVQISSVQTEGSWVYRSGRYDLHPADIVQFDECHVHKQETAQRLFRDHKCPKIGWTATPLDISHMYDKLIVAGTKRGLRECGALLPADVFAGPEINTKVLKTRQENGEFSRQELAQLYSPGVKTILSAEVIKWYFKLNPQQTPTVLFAPGVKESVWFAQQFEAAGVRAAHVDGTDIYIDGNRIKTSDETRREILDEFAAGGIKVLCNRFVLREGVDVPEMGCVLLATPFGSLASYVQSVGRVLRNHPSLDRVTVIDFGGNWWRHPSPNQDLPWEEYFHKTAAQIRNQREDRFREKQEKEPVRCPSCGRVMAPGSSSCLCGYELPSSTREVIQLSGKVKHVSGDVYAERKRERRSDTEAVWESYYWKAFNSKNRMTFRQAEGLFFMENYYWPPRDLPKMPKDPELMDMRVCDTDREYLHSHPPAVQPVQTAGIQKELF